MAQTRNRNARSNSNFACQIDGVFDGSFVKKASGGRVSREVVTHNMGPSNERPKGLGGKLKAEPITLEVAMGMGSRFCDWINEAFRANPMYKDGVIFEANQQMQVVREVKFFRAIITEVSIPAMDAGGNEHMYLTIKVQPEWIEVEEYGSPRENLQVKQGMSKARDWTASNFNFEVQGMGSSSNQVVKVDSFTWKAVVKEDHVSDDKWAGWVMCGFEMPQLKVTFNSDLNQYFDDMYKQMVHDGMSSETALRWATLTFKDLSEKEISELRFERMGLVGSPTGSYDAAGQDIARKDVELYFSHLEMNIDPSATDNT